MTRFRPLFLLSLCAAGIMLTSSNGELDTNFVGMPVEDYCASRDARGTFGPPSFDDAKFDYRGGTKRLSVRLK